MKRLTIIMAAIVCLAISAMAQPNADQPLSPSLWKQGLATCAHYTACDRRFGKKIEEIKAQYPQGYTLDNLNPSSSYTWYVRTDCGDGTYAVSFSQVSFSTPDTPSITS